MNRAARESSLSSRLARKSFLSGRSRIEIETEGSLKDKKSTRHRSRLWNIISQPPRRPSEKRGTRYSSVHQKGSTGRPSPSPTVGRKIHGPCMEPGLSDRVDFARGLVLRGSEYRSYEVGRILASSRRTQSLKSISTDLGHTSPSDVPRMKGTAAGRFREVHLGPAPIEGRMTVKTRHRNGESQLVDVPRLHTDHEARKFYNERTKHRILHSKRRAGMKSPCTAKASGRDTPQT